MSKKLKSKCCERYKTGKKPCKGCPTVAGLSKKKRKKLLAKYRD